MYSIGELSDLTGLNTNTLRTWERRYDFPNPTRTPTGRRIYSKDDVVKLRLVSSLLNRGEEIGVLINLSIEQLQAKDISGSRGEPKSIWSEETEFIRSQLESHILSNDVIAFRRDVLRTLLSFPPVTAIGSVLAPIMNWTGQKWQAGQISVATEHVVSVVIRQSVFSAASTNNWQFDDPPILFGTPAGEHHEIGCLFAWFLTVSKGRAAVYLGPNLPAEQLAEAVKMFSSELLVLSAVNPGNFDMARSEIGKITELLPHSCQLWVGHPRDQDYSGIISNKLTRFSDYSEFEDSLKLV